MTRKSVGISRVLNCSDKDGTSTGTVQASPRFCRRVRPERPRALHGPEIEPPGAGASGVGRFGRLGGTARSPAARGAGGRGIPGSSGPTGRSVLGTPRPGRTATRGERPTRPAPAPGSQERADRRSVRTSGGVGRCGRTRTMILGRSVLGFDLGRRDVDESIRCDTVIPRRFREGIRCDTVIPRRVRTVPDRLRVRVHPRVRGGNLSRNHRFISTSASSWSSLFRHSARPPQM